MFESLSNNLGSIIVIVYLLLVAVVGILGMVALAILHKHAEKKSIATMISVLFVVIFTIIFLASLGPLSNV